MQNSKIRLYTGSWGNKEQTGCGKGVSVFEFDSEQGNIIFKSRLETIEEPGILAVSPDGRFMYCINEMTQFPDGEFATGGGITAMAIDPKDGTLSLINQTPALGSLPAYLAVDKTGRFIGCAIHGSFAVTSRYERDSSGQYQCHKTYDTSGVSLFRIRDDGGVEPGCDLITFDTPGSYLTYKNDMHLADHGFPGTRVASPAIFQSRATVHSINFDQDNRAIVCERGSDMLYLMQIDPEKQCYRLLYAYQARMGVAPRHLAVHPTRPYFYITNEMESSVTAFAFSADRLSFSEIQSIPTLEADSLIPNAPSDIQIDPSGRFVYASNRGDNSIAAYAVDLQTGKLQMLQILKLGEPSPRGFAIDPSGRFLVVGNMDSNCLTVYRIDPSNGTLSNTGVRAPVESPTCIRFVVLPDAE